jgi:hypothetical protein
MPGADRCPERETEGLSSQVTACRLAGPVCGLAAPAISADVVATTARSSLTPTLASGDAPTSCSHRGLSRAAGRLPITARLLAKTRPPTYLL